MKLLLDECASFEHEPEELGLDPKTAVKIKEIKQLRPFVTGQTSSGQRPGITMSSGLITVTYPRIAMNPTRMIMTGEILTNSSEKVV